jgi:CBS-domain-containing membrane protein
MTTVAKPLLTLRASDLMSPDVTAIPERISLRAAAHVLAQFDISGAPVVDDNGRCIGVLSGHDFVRWAEQSERPVRTDNAHQDGGPFSAWQIMDIEALPADEVSRFMTRDPVTVSPGEALGTLASRMRDAHIHRVIVVDAEGHPIGIVSSSDVLAAVADDATRASLVSNW